MTTLHFRLKTLQQKQTKTLGSHQGRKWSNARNRPVQFLTLYRRYSNIFTKLPYTDVTATSLPNYLIPALQQHLYQITLYRRYSNIFTKLPYIGVTATSLPNYLIPALQQHPYQITLYRRYSNILTKLTRTIRKQHYCNRHDHPLETVKSLATETCIEYYHLAPIDVLHGFWMIVYIHEVTTFVTIKRYVIVQDI